MKTQLQFSVKAFNSFNIQAIAPKIFFPTSIVELTELANKNFSHFYVLGEGSNTLFCDKETPIIIKPSFKGIKLKEDEDYFYVTVACSENWHDFVQFCIKTDIYGLENLALIPGSVGAAPVQNIGAYGVEVGDFIDTVSWFDFSEKKIVNYSNAQCQFSYRDSVFKRKLTGAGLITHVAFKFPKNWQPVIGYQGLSNLTQPISAENIMNKVIQLRQEKLPDPNILANAGSFFKNPIVTKAHFDVLQHQYPEMPYYPQNNGDVKLAAGWLIEQTGLKGFRHGDVGVHEKQALVIVNYGDASGQDIVDLASYIQQEVDKLFSIKLIVEVRFIAQQEAINNVTAGGGQ